MLLLLLLLVVAALLVLLLSTAAAAVYRSSSCCCCCTNQPRVALRWNIGFDEDHLKGDAIHVFDSLLGPDYDLPKTLTTKLCAKLEGGSSSPFCSSYGGITPLEVRYTVPVNGSNTSVW